MNGFVFIVAYDNNQILKRRRRGSNKRRGGGVVIHKALPDYFIVIPAGDSVRHIKELLEQLQKVK